ncbi:MAG: hypothetical protein ABID54_05760 [Pseudomonadota bacterium]
MKVTQNVLDIVDEIKRRNAYYIFIDGCDGSGKSTLANEIAQKLTLLHINLDDYLEKNRGNFVDFIKYDLLKNEIDNSNCPVIVEGVCVLAVAQKLQINCDVHIYVKRMSDYGAWKDDDLYNEAKDVDAFLAEQNTQHRKFCEAMAQIEGEKYDPENTTIPKLTEELIRYHYEFKPQETADIIYERLS